MLPHQTKDLALYYLMRWIGNRVGFPVHEEALHGGMGIQTHASSTEPKEVDCVRTLIAEFYAWQSYLIISSGTEASGNFVVIDTTSGVTKTFHWGKKE